jgi:hypothetical protein
MGGKWLAQGTRTPDLTNSYKQGKFADWREDSLCEQMLRSILPALAVDQVKVQVVGGLRAAIGALENQFITEAGMDKPHE